MNLINYAVDVIKNKKDQFFDNQQFKTSLNKCMSSKITDVTTKELYDIADKSYD